MSRILSLVRGSEEHFGPVGEGEFRSGVSVALPDKDRSRWAQQTSTCYLVSMPHCEMYMLTSVSMFMLAL